MTGPVSRLVCAGCGSSPDVLDPYPFRCPRLGEGDVDHVLVKVLAPAGLSFPVDLDALKRFSTSRRWWAR